MANPSPQPGDYDFMGPTGGPRYGTQGFLDSPGAAALINAGGAGLQAYGQSQQNAANNQATGTQRAAQLIQDQFNERNRRNDARAKGVLDADPLGADQQYAQRNAILSAILPNLRNAGRTHVADAGIDAAIPDRSGSGGIMNVLPQGGFDPNMIKSMFGNDATMSSIAKRNMELTTLDPRTPTPNLAAMYGEDAKPYMSQIQGWAQQLSTMEGYERQQYEGKLQKYIDKMVDEEGDSGDGFWHKFARVAGIVGAVAATVMTAGGASPLIAAAVGAGSGALGAWGNGAGAGGTAAAAGIGAAGPLTSAIRGR